MPKFAPVFAGLPRACYNCFHSGNHSLRHPASIEWLDSPLVDDSSELYKAQVSFGIVDSLCPLFLLDASLAPISPSLPRTCLTIYPLLFLAYLLRLRADILGLHSMKISFCLVIVSREVVPDSFASRLTRRKTESLDCSSLPK